MKNAYKRPSIQVNLSMDELDMLKAVSTSSGIPMTEIIRSHIRADYKELRKKLDSVGLKAAPKIKKKKKKK